MAVNSKIFQIYNCHFNPFISNIQQHVWAEMALKTSKKRKAPGPDRIYLEFLNYRGLTLITGLHIVLNTCWITCSIPHTGEEPA